MKKLIFLLHAKPGMARAAFIERYESGHVSLALEIIPYMTEYRRTYLPEQSGQGMSGVGDATPQPEFDVVTELWFEESAMAEMFERLASTNAGALIAEDETFLFDRTRSLMMEADEHITPADRLMAAPAHGKAAVKMVCFKRRRPGMTREAFIEHYETTYAEWAMKSFVDETGRCVFGQFRRSFPVPGSVMQIGAEGSPPYAYDFDVMTEIWFWTQADFDRFRASSRDPAVAGALAGHEAELFDARSTTMSIGDEYITTPEQCAAARKRFDERVAA